VEAEGWLDAALATDDPWVRRRRGAIEESLTEVRRHLGRVLLTGAPEGAEVRIGGRRAGTLPMSASVRVAAGLVELEVRAEGHLAWRQMVEVLPGASFERAVTLEALQAPEAPPPAEVARCAAGMEMRRGLCYPVAVRDPDAPGRPWRVVGFVGVGLAAVSAGLAVALGLGANSTEADYQARCGGASVPAACLEDWVDTQASLDTRAGLINTFWVLTGVGATPRGRGLRARRARHGPTDSCGHLAARGNPGVDMVSRARWRVVLGVGVLAMGCSYTLAPPDIVRDAAADRAPPTDRAPVDSAVEDVTADAAVDRVPPTDSPVPVDAGTDVGGRRGLGHGHCRRCGPRGRHGPRA
jgi:hypothetical protein